ncbi:AraC family transcriptional regulator of adaptative response / DNA-3-methyladenine glycosylase II [Paenarthrobacter nitroguajacolicus]|uniref:DNA-3-methyladenine glycosylase 2 family protein n=1 Tax=Paenarthrobacter nitroguajacolicus TaxID=211146 RepID=UPI0028637BE1|nr:AlkA N-terminal domain-containing protein [Paenarthrobacter nitroguajacolicus]MDR6985542.1 AraC family transcriptional regulator of adaptative response / DNA-3-methyladenine glycosylase II [Paenarthrobacter nitroguajacolicus]
MDFWQRYRAIDARDTRFDGQFFTAVSSTGIYCRPSCPARTPKAGNVIFYETSAAAHEAGYRACKRCLPEAVPGTPAWNIRSDIAGRAMRLINDGVITREGVDGLARRLGYSARQLNRILSNELGAGPLSLARASRAQTARTLLVSTEMRLADVAFASGFNSVRQFNDTIGEVFAMTPTALRATGAKTGQRRGAATPSDLAPGTLTLTLPYREPFDPGIFDFLAVRAVPGIELSGSGPDGTRTYARTLRLPRGNASFSVTYSPSSAGKPLQLTALAVDLHDLPALLSRVRRLFDLDADPQAIDDALAMDLRLVNSVLATPGIRVPGAVDPQELLIRAMIGQQITVAAARTALTQLSVAGSPAGAGAPGLERLFPTSSELADHGRTLLWGPQRRIDSIVATADAMATGALEFGYGDDFAGLERKLLPLPGVGPWTVGYVAMRVLGAPDVFLANDAAVRSGLKLLPADTGLSADFREVSPWRSYATMHLWRAAAKRTTLKASPGNTPEVRERPPETRRR